MKTELTIISDDLNHGIIDENQARTLLLGLLGVSDFYLLKEGDIIREGDEFTNGDSWSKTGVVNERYNENDFKPHRRMIN